MEAKHDSLAGRTALVTGAGRRLGRAIAEELAAAGVHVAIHYHESQGEAEGLADAVRSRGLRAAALQADLGDARQAEALLTRAAEAMGPVDILVANAAIFPESRLTDVTAAEIQASIEINALAPLLIGRALAAQARPGSIVNLLDARMVDYDARHIAYHLSKRMLFSLTRMMALEFAPTIRVNAVAPGLILPPRGEGSAYLERLAHTNPLGRHGDGADVASAVLFLLRSEFVTGQVIYVDGGRHLKGRVYD